MISLPAAPDATQRSNSLPRRWKRGRQKAALGAFWIIALFSGVLHEQSGADQLDRWWLRTRFSLREWINNNVLPVKDESKADPRIAIVEFDDKSSMAEFDVDRAETPWKNEPIILMGGQLAKAVQQLNRSGARLVALDWMLSIDSQEKLNSNNDELLGQALSQSRHVVFVKFLSPENKYIRPTPSILYSPRDAYIDPDSNLGFAELVNQGGAQYSFIPQTIEEKPEVSFAARIAQKSGFKIPPNQPIRDDGSMLINYADNTGSKGKSSPFERVSLCDVVNAKAPDPRFKDKIVIIGATNKGNNDFHFVPFLESGFTSSRIIPGVELQAHAVATMLEGKAIQEPNGRLVWLLSTILGTFGIGVYALWSWGRAARTVGSFAFAWLVLSFVLFPTLNFALPITLPLLTLLAGCLLMGGYRALSEERERGQVMRIWGQYQDPALIKELLENPNLRSGQGREVEVTVVFIDLKSFTQTVEAMTPSEALKVLNKYLALFATIIREHGGIVDKYLGDGLMAQWGTPITREDHAIAAVMACVEIDQHVKNLTQTLNSSGQTTFGVRISVHSGMVIAGPLGSEEKLEYTIIGDTVNVTSRMQETAKALGCDFLISEVTCAAMGCHVATGREATVEIRGRKAPLRVFEVLSEQVDLTAFPTNNFPTAKMS